MPDSKITALTSISTSTDPANDPLVIVDVSDTSMAATGTTKKVTLNQLLGASGTATLASATITGDLTVNSNVNVGASPAFYGGKIATNGSIAIAGGNYLKLWNSTGTGVAGINAGAADTLTFSLTNAFTTAMTLNSTGLGVGGSPATKIFANVTPPGAGQDGVRVSDGTRLIQMSISGSTYSYQGIGANQNVIYAAGNPLSILSDGQNLRLGTSTTSYVLLDTSGNVGIGVTPSAWASGNKFIDINSSAAFGAFGSSDAMMIGNAYWNGSSWIRKTANNAWRFVIESVSSTPTMTWQLAANGSAGSSITWTQAMTLDTSGNLLVGTTAAAGSASNSTKTVGGLFSTVNGSTASTASGAAVTMFTSPTEATFMVSAYIFGTGAPASYNAIAIVKVSGSTAAITTVSSATGLTISLSGLNVQVTQTSGSPQVIVYSAIRIS